MTDMGVVDLPEPRIGPASKLAPKPIKFVLNWGRRYSLWVFNFGLACCAIEFIATSMSRHDFIRLGVIPFAPGPRQADLMVVSGTVSDKMAPAVRRLYEQMPEPKYVISFGACSNCGGPYWDSYCVTKGVDQIIPVDVYVPGCPPRPEALLHGIIRLQEKIAAESLGSRYAEPGEAVSPPPEVTPKPPTPAVFRRPLVLPPLPEPEEMEAAGEITQSILIPGTEADAVSTRELSPVREEQVSAVEETLEVPPADASAVERTVEVPPVDDRAAERTTQRLPLPGERAEPEPAAERTGEDRPVERTQELPPAEEVRKAAEQKQPRKRGGRLRRFAEPPPVDALDDPDIIPGLRDDD
jgi:NADH-quinone oxidoreductase B subunit